MASDGIDIVVQIEAEGRAKKLLVADMDSTMITIECLDELADYAGLKAIGWQRSPNAPCARRDSILQRLLSMNVLVF